MVLVRLNKYLAEAGVASRRKADELILLGVVKVNGKIVKDLGIKIDDARDNVTYKGKAIKPDKPIIFMFNKPQGVTSTMADAHATQTIADYFKQEGRVFPVGRLDKESQGLILVTNDGELANKLTHPRFEHEKEYKVIITGELAPIAVKLGRSFRLDGHKTQPMQVKSIKQFKQNQWEVVLVLKEGRKRQIRRIAELLDYQVVQLQRVRIGKLKLGTLPIGKYAQVLERDII